MNEKQQQLTFDKGITNVPSDALCSDNTLEECLGLVYDNGEHRVIQKPKEFMNIESKSRLLYVHQERYLYIVGTGESTTLYWKNKNDVRGTSICSTTEDVKITSIGNTVILSNSDGLKYLLWTGNGYDLTEGALPDISLKFSLTKAEEEDISAYNDRFIHLEGMFYTRDVRFLSEENTPHRIPMHGYAQGKEEDARSGIIGLVSKRLNKVKEDKKFAFPFWIRYAVRLYDSSYTYISNPILMLPTVRHNCDAFICKYGTGLGDEGKIERNLDDSGSSYVNYMPRSSELKFKVEIPSGVNLDDWENVISGVDVFVSQEVRGFDIDGKWDIINPYIVEDTEQTEDRHNQVLCDGCEPGYWHSNMVETPPSGQSNDYYSLQPDEAYGCYFSPEHYSDKDIIDQLISNSTFYKLFELTLEDLKNISSETDAKDYIKKGILETITSQDQLEHDDYFSRSSLTAEVVKAYNSRLHLADVKRGFFEGFKNFSYTSYGTGKNIKAYTYIRSENGERIVETELSNWSEVFQAWYYYPDPRAYKVEFYLIIGSSKGILLSAPLKEHPGLNGAYLFDLLPSNDTNTWMVPVVVSDLPEENVEPEELQNCMAVSEVNNPFLFLAEGYYYIGLGRINGLATQTVALGQEEHGRHPLTVFTTKGVYGMYVNDTGVYTRPDEFSREVCNYSGSITETDGAVFFSSEKGLMVVVGSQVKCVSEQLGGKVPVYTQENQSLQAVNLDFATFLKTAFIAYDYRDSLLWLFDGTQNGSRYCWIYSIKNGTFSKYDFTDSLIISNAVNDYPDYLIQSGTNVYTLLNRVNINKDTQEYASQIITRPMKLENGLALKSIMQVKHIHDMNTNAKLEFKMFASNDLKNWVELSSLRGMPWKYYKFQYDFEHLIATDRFAGTVLVTQERRTDKLR